MSSSNMFVLVSSFPAFVFSYNEKEDVKVVMQYLMQSGTVSRIGEQWCFRLALVCFRCGFLLELNEFNGILY